MKRMVAGLVLVLLTALAGCIEGPDIDKGGGESAVLEQANGRFTGRIDVAGHVVNSGGTAAWNVVLSFKFFDDGILFLEDKLRIGDIPVGGTKDFSGAFFGRPVTGVFTWEYRADWD